MERREQEPKASPQAAVDESHAVRVARLRRDLALTPSQRLDKFAALCREAEHLRGARRLP